METYTHIHTYIYIYIYIYIIYNIIQYVYIYIYIYIFITYVYIYNRIYAYVIIRTHRFRWIICRGAWQNFSYYIRLVGSLGILNKSSNWQPPFRKGSVLLLLTVSFRGGFTGGSSLLESQPPGIGDRPRPSWPALIVELLHCLHSFRQGAVLLHILLLILSCYMLATAFWPVGPAPPPVGPPF